jgi:O-antigen ligase
MDRVGLVPFVAFAIAPLIYATARQRSFLVAVLVGIGWYLGITALLEGFDAKELTWPGYINDPTVGIHFERARGPFAESTIMGAALIGCLVACVIALKTWRSRAARLAAGVLVPVLLLGTILTLTRAVWLAAGLATAVGVLADPKLRRYFVPLAAIATVAVGVALATVPGLTGQVDERRQDQIPVWDRLNTNAAAWDAFRDEPLNGVGWNQFARRSADYLEQNPNFPLTGNRIEVHNVLLARLAEVGLIGTLPWMLALLLGVAVPAFRRSPTDSDLEPWRIGLLMYGTAWTVIAAFGPMSGAFPNLFLWLLAGIVAIPMTSRPAPAAPGVPAGAATGPVRT